MSMNLKRYFTSPESVTAFFRQQIVRNGDPALAGLEEEIIVLDLGGKPVGHDRFQGFLGDFIRALPGGRVVPGRSIRGGEIPVLKGVYDGGLIQPETNTTLVELAHAPTESAWGCFEQSRAFTQQLTRTAAFHDMLVLGGGAVPSVDWRDFGRDDVVIPNADYVYSWTHMTQGTRPEYCRTVFGTASVHHNMGFNDPERMARYIVTTLRMQPTMIALLGNAPFWNGTRASKDGAPLLSYRSSVQLDYGKLFGSEDGADYLYPDFLIDPDATFASIVDGYLDLPLDRTMVGGRKRSCEGLTMREYLRGYEADGRIYYPDEAALTMMLREPIVDVRPSFTGAAPRVETRAHDAVSQQVSVSLDAFYRGIAASLEEARELMAGIEGGEIRRLRRAVCREGLQARLVHERPEIRTQQDLALWLLDLSERGLQARGLGEDLLLSPLWVLAQTGQNPAQRLLSVYESGGRNMRTVLQAMDYASGCHADGVFYAWPEDAVRFGRQQPIRRAFVCNR